MWSLYSSLISFFFFFLHLFRFLAVTEENVTSRTSLLTFPLRSRTLSTFPGLATTCDFWALTSSFLWIFAPSILLAVSSVFGLPDARWFCCLKWPASIVLNCCLVFLSTRRLWCILGRRCMCWINFTVTWIIVPLAVKSMLINQQLYEVRCLWTETHTKQGYVLFGWWKCCD